MVIFYFVFETKSNYGIDLATIDRLFTKLNGVLEGLENGVLLMH